MDRTFLRQPILPLDQNLDGGESENGGINLSVVLRLLRMRYRLILGTALAVVAVAAVMVFRMTPIYNASSFVMLDDRHNKMMGIDAVLSGLPTDSTSIENQIQILHSRDLMSKVATKLRLDRPPPPGRHVSPSLFSEIRSAINPLHWFSSPQKVVLTPAEQRLELHEAAIQHLLDSETVNEVGGSTAMQVTVSSPIPDMAARIANAIAEQYVQDQLDAKFAATNKTAKWLAGRLQQLSKQMQSADAAVQEYKAQHGITDTPNGGSVVGQQLAEINAQLITARSQLAEAQAKYSRVKQLEASGHAEDIGQVFQSGMIATLRQQQANLLRERAQLATVYGPRHPKMIDINSQIKSIDEKIHEEVKRVVETVANDVDVAQAQVNSLQASLNGLEKQTQSQSQAMIKLSELQAKASSAHQLYQAFLSKFKETQGQTSIETPDARIISRAVVPTVPSAPAKGRDLELALIGGLLLGFGFATLAERLDFGFRRAAQIERALGVPVLGILPELKGGSKATRHVADMVIDKPLSAFAEAVRGVQMGVALSKGPTRPKLLLVTSSVPDEGKTTVALSVARSAARGGQRVLLIDCDLRNPSLSEAIGFGKVEQGLIEVLALGADIGQCIRKDPKSSVLVLPATHIKCNPQDVLTSTRMTRLLDAVKTQFDLIVIDSAPLLPVYDSKLLAPMMDAVLFVVRWERTPREAVVSAAQ
ncbi:MAG: polysaccharide biosynthesis tyrosine autokinase, partial [Alphaproteobacteria bacterium]|nr:polysaccharide biosynthesis tyrosine autokinase [Alphaproteobacteria bacterium]